MTTLSVKQLYELRNTLALHFYFREGQADMETSLFIADSFVANQHIEGAN